jgi:hypothetical protein
MPGCLIRESTGCNMLVSRARSSAERASAYGAEGRGFKSLRARQLGTPRKRVGQLDHSGNSISTDDPGGMALPQRVLYEQDAPWPEASDLTIAYLNLGFPSQPEEELSARCRMPIAKPASRVDKQRELSGRSERRKIDRRRWRCEDHSLEFHLLIREVRLPIGIRVQTRIADGLHGLPPHQRLKTLPKADSKNLYKPPSRSPAERGRPGGRIQVLE